MLRTRIIAALVAIPLVVVGVWLGGPVFMWGVTAVALIAGWEFNRMMKAGGYHPTLLIILGLILATLKK